jgi:hypothetical protein
MTIIVTEDCQENVAEEAVDCLVELPPYRWRDYFGMG